MVLRSAIYRINGCNSDKSPTCDVNDTELVDEVIYLAREQTFRQKYPRAKLLPEKLF